LNRLRKLHSLTGVVPLGLYLFLHLGAYATAPDGQFAFDARQNKLEGVPLLGIDEVFGIVLPLLFHAVYGVKLALEATDGSHPYPQRWMHTMQRLTGLFAFGFVGYHLAEYRLPWLLGRMSPDAFFPTLAARLSSTTSGVPLVAILYLVGLAATTVHFATGLWGFSVSWGFVKTRRAQALAAGACGTLSVFLLLSGARGIFYFATGARIFDLGGSREQCDVVDLSPRASPTEVPARDQAPAR
jgi:succinate dehydrogenase/fumarate reductase cytochrome b subunit (b558 family)